MTGEALVFLTLGLPPIFYPVDDRGDEKDSGGFTAPSKAYKSECTAFYKYLSTLAMFYVNGVELKCITVQYLQSSNICDSLTATKVVKYS